MSTSSLSSYSSYGALSTAKKTPKRFVKDSNEPDKAEVIKGQLDSLKLELDTYKMNMSTTTTDETIKSQDNWMDQINCNKLMETIDSLASGLSTKLDIIRQLSSVPKDKPSIVLNDEALKQAKERLDDAICILENLRT